MSLAGFFVASTVVTLLQFVRLRDMRLTPLLALFAFAALAHAEPDWRRAYWWHVASGLAGLGVLAVIAHRRHPSP